VPLVAIGGLTLERAGEIASAADAGAVISALLPSARAPSEARARALQRALGGG
jgi:thiamine monophosphate synthase